MKKVNFDDILRDPFYGGIIRVLEAKTGHSLPEALKKQMIHQVQWSGLRSKQLLNWVKSFLSLAERIDNDTASDSDFGMFWIRFRGVLTEAYKDFEAFRDLEDQIKSKPDSPDKRNLLATLNIGNAIKNMLDQLTDLELKAISFFRHTNSHVFQNAYRVRIPTPKKIDEVIETFKEPLLSGKEFSIDDFLDDISEIYKTLTEEEKYKYGYDNSVAVRLVSKLKKELNNLSDAIAHWEKVGFLS